MSVRMGRFGPFVQIGTKDDADKPRFAGLRPGQKMDAITHAEALELFKLPRKLGLTAQGEEILTNTGRFGPYVKYGAKYVSLKIDDPYTITPERALEVIREKEIADANRLILDFPDASAEEQSETDVPDLSSIDGYPKNFKEIYAFQGTQSGEIFALG